MSSPHPDEAICPTQTRRLPPRSPPPDYAEHPTTETALTRTFISTVGIIRTSACADDFVVMVSGSRDNAEALRCEVAEVLAPMGLRLSEAKTQVVHLDEGFDFLGFRIQRRRKRGTNEHHVYTYPSKKALRAVKTKVRRLTSRSNPIPPRALLLRVNAVLRGWANYFKYGVSKRTFSYLDTFAWHRVAYWLRRRHHGMSWKVLRRRFIRGRWDIVIEGTSLLMPSTITVSRYRYRGTRIPTPWTTEAPSNPA